MLVVDDSITVREVERQLLLHKGYDVAVAVDGMDGWNKVRAEQFDLVVSDVDMPRMTGLELVAAVRADDEAPRPAGHHRLVQGPRGGPAPRAGSRGELLPDQEQFPRQPLHRGGRGPDRHLRTVAGVCDPGPASERPARRRPASQGPATGRFRHLHDPVSIASMRIAIVNDLSLAREVLRRLVLSVPGHSVAWVAEDGDDAVRKAAADRPDAILMDLVMPRLNGVEATRQIMKQSPCPILVVTATIPGHYELVIQAMGAGALDAVETPALGPGGTIQNGNPLLARLAKLADASRGAAWAGVQTPSSTRGADRRPSDARSHRLLDRRAGRRSPRFSRHFPPASPPRS